jgi:hypothetical protein
MVARVTGPIVKMTSPMWSHTISRPLKDMPTPGGNRKAEIYPLSSPGRPGPGQQAAWAVTRSARKRPGYSLVLLLLPDFLPPKPSHQALPSRITPTTSETPARSGWWPVEALM